MMGGKGSGRKPGGRPPRLTKELAEKIAAMIATGNYFETACEFYNVRPRHGREWMQKGRQTKRQPYYGFAQAVKKAEAKAEATGVARIRTHGGKTWQAEAWYLERKFPQRWGRCERKPEEDKPERGPLTLSAMARELNLGALTAEELRTFILLVGKAEGGGDGPK